MLSEHKLTPGCLPELPPEGGFCDQGSIRFQEPQDGLVLASPLGGLWLWAAVSEGLGSLGGSLPTLD